MPALGGHPRQDFRLVRRLEAGQCNFSHRKISIAETTRASPELEATLICAQLSLQIFQFTSTGAVRVNCRSKHHQHKFLDTVAHVLGEQLQP